MSNNIFLSSDRLDEFKIQERLRKTPYYIDCVEKTPERCLIAVTEDGLTLKLIPKALHNSCLCIAAVKQNGLAIRYVSKKILSNDICLEAIKNDGLALCYIPEGFLSEKLYFEAVKQNGLALRYVPNEQKINSLCINAIEQNGLALEYIPKSILTKDLYSAAIAKNGLALEFVPDNKKNKNLCIIAVTNNSLALKYVPNRFLTLDLCQSAIVINWRAFLYTSDGIYTLENCCALLEQVIKDYENISKMSGKDRSYIKEIIKRFPDNVNGDIQIIKLERELGARYFKEKTFDKNTNKFVTKEFICYQEDDEIKEYMSFSEFYKNLQGNLDNANLSDFNFLGINLKNFNIDGAYISSKVLKQQNLYDDNFYIKNIKDCNQNIELTFSVKNELVSADAVLHDLDIGSSLQLNDNTNKMYYISDIHLNHKLLKAFPLYATKQEVMLYIRDYVEKMIATVESKSFNDYLLVAGDISFNFEISELFYMELIKLWHHSRIVVVLGNHELWDFNENGTQGVSSSGVEFLVQKYRTLFTSLGICFLHNELLISSNTIFSNSVILTEKELRAIEPDVLKERCLKSAFMILGGLGFSGLNLVFNATQGIYRNCIKSFNEDMEQTKLFDFIYNKLSDALGDNKVVVLTHTPKENWSKTAYNSNWIYVNGHTHRNDYWVSKKKTVYSDNQIGYYTSSVGLKHFNISNQYDTFRYYTDGIYIISREEYLDFSRGIGTNMSFNRDGKIHMLKKNNIYCFIYGNPNSGNLHLLNGGALSKLDNNIEYYYERMSRYSEVVREMLNGYNKALKFISNIVKQIGGDGTIHGCIVDVDFYNHVYLNPIDGKITPYYALSIVEKYVYPDLQALLLEQRQDLYDNYTKYLDSKADEVVIFSKNAIEMDTILPQFISETFMYELSRIIKSFQYLTEANVIRIWNEQVMNMKKKVGVNPNSNLLEMGKN